MYRRFGSRVTVVETQERLIPRDDEDVSRAVQDILEGEGVAFRLQAECVEVAAHADGVAVRVECAEQPRELVGSHLLLAIGRVPNTHDLGLEQAGVALTPGVDFGPGGEGYLRISYANSLENISEGMDRLQAFLQAEHS